MASSNIKIGTDIWGHIYGIVGLIGLGFTGIYTYHSIKNATTSDSIPVIQSFSLALAVMTLTFVIAWVYFIRTIKRLEESPYLLRERESELDELNISHRILCESNHSINHYYRNICLKLESVLIQVEQKPDRVKKDELASILEASDLFMNKLTIALQQYFSVISGYRCAVTVKIVNSKDNLVKTLYRDPLSLRKRRASDKICYPDGGYYSIYENTGFSVIIDDIYSNVFFANDDLKALYEDHQYENSNEFWHEHYNACIVVPISLITGDGERDVIGFLTVDNENGNLNVASNVEYLLSIGDLLYGFLVKYLKVANFAVKKFNQKLNPRYEKLLQWN